MFVKEYSAYISLKFKCQLTQLIRWIILLSWINTLFLDINLFEDAISIENSSSSIHVLTLLIDIWIETCQNCSNHQISIQILITKVYTSNFTLSIWYLPNTFVTATSHSRIMLRPYIKPNILWYKKQILLTTRSSYSRGG